MILKESLEAYSEAEFLEFLEEFFENKHHLTGAKYQEHIEKLVEHFCKITEHPRRSDLIFYPENEVEDSPESILATVKAWRTANKKTGFRSD